MGFVEVRPKIVWVAVVLALVSGPIGLAYCTAKGAMIMIFVSILLHFLLGYWSMLIVLPLCAIWAWRAAREQASMMD